jgi:hypothetical protein
MGRKNSVWGRAVFSRFNKKKIGATTTFTALQYISEQKEPLKNVSCI